MVKNCPAVRTIVPRKGANHGLMNDECTIMDVLVPYLKGREGKGRERREE